MTIMRKGRVSQEASAAVSECHTGHAEKRLAARAVGSECSVRPPFGSRHYLALIFGRQACSRPFS